MCSARGDAWFAPSGRGTLEDFWSVYDARYDVVLAESDPVRALDAVRHVVTNAAGTARVIHGR